MNRLQLAPAVRKKRIRPDSYTFDPATPGERYVMCVERGGWIVYFSEHGLARGVERFETEDEACRHLLARLEADPSMRAGKAPKPAPPQHIERRERVATWQLFAAVALLVALAVFWAGTHQEQSGPTSPTPAVSGR